MLDEMTTEGVLALCDQCEAKAANLKGVPDGSIFLEVLVFGEFLMEFANCYSLVVIDY